MRRGAWLGVALAGGSIVALGGCGKDRSDQGPVSVPAPARTAGAAGPAMRVIVSELMTDPTIDAQSVRSVLRDAETSLVECVDGKSSGVVAMSFPLEHDGSVGTLVEGSKTTLKDERARLCIERKVAELRFSSSSGSRPEIAVSLEVRTRREVE